MSFKCSVIYIWMHLYGIKHSMLTCLNPIVFNLFLILIYCRCGYDWEDGRRQEWHNHKMASKLKRLDLYTLYSMNLVFGSKPSNHK